MTRDWPKTPCWYPYSNPPKLDHKVSGVHAEISKLTQRKTHEAKKAISRTLGLAKIDCHMDFFAIWIRGAASTSRDFRSAMLKNKENEIGQSRNNENLSW
jgi:hypothetical protein